MTTRILLADDHQIIRDGLASLLERQQDMEVIQQASDGFQAVSLSRDLNPDVVVTGGRQKRSRDADRQFP